VIAPERAFAAIALAAGLLLALVLPPGAAPDETRHLSRVYAMSEGIFRVPGTRAPRVRIPRSIPTLHRAVNGADWPKPPPRRTPAQMASLLRQPLDPARRVGVANAGIYPPVVYLPQLVGVAPGRWLGLSPAALIYLGRLVSLAAWVALTALAIRLAPARRWTLAVLSLTPTAVASAASISADPMTNAAALLFTVAVVRSASRTGPFARSEGATLVATAAFLALVKPGYWPLALAVLAIPPARCGGRRRQLALAASIGVWIAAPSLAWLAYAQASAPAPASPGADPAAQLHLVLAHPAGFLAVLARSLAVDGAHYWVTFVGRLGPLIVALPNVIYVLWAVALAAMVAFDGPLRGPLGDARRGWLAVASAAALFTMLTMAYLGWNQPGEPTVRGVQGRYWAPAMPALAFALPAWDLPLPAAVRVPVLAIAAGSLAAAVGAVLAVCYRF
jgi:uncharacterized membrane protein